MNIHIDAAGAKPRHRFAYPDLTTGSRAAPRERLRRLWIYAACAGFFCLGLISVAAVVGEAKFVAKATIIAEGSQTHRLEMPFSANVPEGVLRAVVEAEGLADDPEFVSPRWTWIARAARLVGMRDFASRYDTLSGQAVASLEQAVAVRPQLQGDRLDVEAASSDAAKAMRIADRLAQAMLDDQKERADANEMQSRRAAAATVADFAARLQRAKQRLGDFQAAHNLGSAGDETGAISGRDLGDPEAAVAEAKADMDRVSRALAAGRTSGAGELHFPMPDLDRLTSQYDDLRQQFEKSKLSLGDKHPDLIALDGQLRALQKEIRAQWLKAADIASRNYRSAQARVVAFGRETQETGSESLEKLRADIDLARNDYELALRLQANIESSADMQPSLSLTKAEVAPSATRRPQGLILGAVLMLGAMFGAGRTLADTGRRSRRRPSTKSEASEPSPSIFPIPRIKGDWLQETLRLKPRLDTACQEVLDRPRSDFSLAIEHLFELETDVATSGTTKVLFVSKEDKLGTTTVAVNFAHVAAKAGHRVLLIEANRRRPILASLMSPNVRVNLIDLHGTKRIICLLRPRLSVIPLFDEETSVVLAERAHHCMKGIHRHFDVVILDGGLFVADDEMMDMTRAVNRVFHLTAQGIEWKAGGRTFGSGF